MKNNLVDIRDGLEIYSHSKGLRIAHRGVTLFTFDKSFEVLMQKDIWTGIIKMISYAHPNVFS